MMTDNQSFRILFLEHERVGEEYRRAIERSGVVVDEVRYEERGQFIASLREVLKRKRFDLLITDAYFLPHGQDHNFPGVDGEYLLADIMRCVREIEDERMRVAVMSHFEILANHLDDLHKVHYLWDKAASPVSFVVWQIQRIQEDAQKHLPQHALIDSILEITEQDMSPPSPPWRKEMMSMVRSYRNRVGGREQIESIRLALEDIATRIGEKCGLSFKKLLDALVAAEPLNLASKPSGWGHLRHSVNVFWLGYYMLNTGWLNSLEISSKLFPGKTLDIVPKIRAVNAAWFLAAVFHDVGLIVEKAPNLVEHFNKLLKVYPHCDMMLELKGRKGIHELQKTHLSKVATVGSPSLADALVGMAGDEAMPAGDHGLMSACCLLATFGEIVKPCEIVEQAALAVALHNLSKAPSKNKIPELDLDEFPLAGMLVLCDQIEVWDRQTGQESIYTGRGIECAELSNLSVGADNRLQMKVNYLPFRYVAPNETLMEKIHRDLKDAIDENVMPALNNLNISGAHKRRVKLTYMLDGRREIRPPWVSPADPA